MEHWRVSVKSAQLTGDWWVRAETGARAITVVRGRLKRKGWNDLPGVAEFKCKKVRQSGVARVYMEVIR